jgi:hypothetical protein
MWHVSIRQCVLAIALTTTFGAASAQSQKIGAPPEAVNMQLLGVNDM